MQKKDFFLGALLGAALGAIGGILFAPKSGKETRHDIARALNEIKDKVADQISKIQKFTRERYESMVDDVVGEYESAEKITEEQASEIKKDLKGSFEKIRDILGK